MAEQFEFFGCRAFFFEKQSVLSLLFAVKWTLLQGSRWRCRFFSRLIVSFRIRMERIRNFNGRRGLNRALDAENAGDAENSQHMVMAGTTKKREQYEKRQVKMDRRELETRYVELQAKLEDTEAFWKDDSRHKDKRICELERQTKNLADSNSFLNIKLKMLEQELADKQEEASSLKQQLAKAEQLQRSTALKWSSKFY